MNPYVIKKPIITEKSIGLANSQNTYTFLVDKNASKNQICSAIKEMYQVDIIKIRTIKAYTGKKKTGKKRLLTKDGLIKKAMITLKSGQSIDLFDLGGN